MSNDKATAILALFEANKALQLAHRALVRLGANDEAQEVLEMGEDTGSILAELTGAVARPEAVAS